MQLDEIMIELVGYCNASCCYCTWRTRPTGKQLMDPALAARCLDEAKEMGVGLVRCHGVGEPTLHPQFTDILWHAESIGINNSFSTNGYTFSGRIAEEVAGLTNIETILAVHFVMPEKFARRCADHFLAYLARGSKNREVCLLVVCHQDARPHLDGFLDEFLAPVEKSANARIFLKQPQTWPKNGPQPGFVPDIRHPKVSVDAVATPRSLGKDCNMPDRFLGILADGTAAPCCVGTEDWGLPRVSEVGLRGVWESPRMEAIRRMCRDADDAILCGGCKKRTDCL